MRKTLIIAEAGVNHNGSLELAKKLVDKAVYANADVIKFQTFKAENLTTKTAPKADYQNINMSGENNQYKMLKNLELKNEAFVELKKYCQTKGIEFLSTAFDISSIEFLTDLGIERWKIPSGEITNLPYLKKIAEQDKPIILSTGMCTIEDISHADRKSVV